MTLNIDLISRLSGAHVLVIGDLMLDCFVSGEISRISPEAPIPVFRKQREDFVLGGAGNVVRNLRSLGCQVSLVAACGEDAEGRRLEQMLEKLDLVSSVLLRADGRPTTVKTRFVAQRQQVLRVDSEDSRAVDDTDASRIVEAAGVALKECTAVILSDYGKGLLTERVLRDVIQAAAEAGCPVLIDPKGNDYSSYRSASLLTPNRKELAEATGLPTETDEEVERAANRLINECGVGAVLATRGSDGMSLIQAGTGPAHLRALAREVFDVSGAGDTVIAVTAAGIAAGAPMVEACGLANLAAGIVVGKVGTATVRPDELIRCAHQRDLSRAETKVVSREALLEMVERWRREGRRIGFTNGVFDLLHLGHVSLLRQAATACDRLIVGLNGDESVRRISGHPPVQNETSRSAIVASLESVDAIIVYSEDTPEMLLEILRPEVLIKGANYGPDEVVGADLVRSYGGDVLLVEVEEALVVDRRLARITNGTF